jgi:hypothetical protein
MITQAERKKRMENIKYARASVELEGFKISEETKKLNERYINGEISLTDMGRLIQNNLKSSVASHAGQN